jgi:hypothetical protein
MIQEVFYKITVEKHTTGVKEQQEFVRLYESEHPKMKEPNPPEQYGYKSVIKPYVEKSVLLEQKLESVDIERVLKAINKGL